MGASQSKKRRKEKRKRRRLSPNHDMPRSVSVDAIRTMSVSPALSPCPHCQHSLSWSDCIGAEGKHSPYHHHCHNHNHQYQHHQQQQQQHRLSQRCLRGQYQEMTVGGASFESCPNCYSITTTTTDSGQQGQGRLQPPSSRRNPQHAFASSPGISSIPTGYHSESECSFLSVNRTTPHQASLLYSSSSSSSSKPRYREASDGDAQTIDNNRHERQRDRTGSSPLSLLQGDIPSQRSALQVPPYQKPPLRPSSAPTCISTTTISQKSPPQLSSSSSTVTTTTTPSAANDNQVCVNEDKKISVLDEDEESKVSRWVKRKQMAQQLRDLRRHLENGETSRSGDSALSARNDNSFSEDDSPTGQRVQTETGLELNSPVLTNCPPPDNAPYEAGMISPTRRSLRSKFSRMSNYRFLDNHPIMTKLQNEQNNRLETMERRMKEIRESAMQEAERRRFAEIFPAKNDDSETQRMLEEAKATLEKLKEEKKRRKTQSPEGHPQESQVQAGDDSRVSECPPLTGEHESGEIIPVCVIPQRSNKNLRPKFLNIVSSHNDHSKESDKKQPKPFWLKNDWPEMNLNQPLTWLLLPFLLFPLILRMLLSFILNISNTALCDRRPSGSNGRGSNRGSEERDGRRLSESHSGLSLRGSKKYS